MNINTLKEVEQMIAKKETEEGVTEQIKEGKDVEWQSLRYSF